MSPLPEPREAGRELDALIEQHVFGATWQQSQDTPVFTYLVRGSLDRCDTVLARRRDGVLDGYYGRPHSTDIAAAWTVVEKLRADGWEVDLGTDAMVYQGWLAQVSRVVRGQRKPDYSEGEADTAPHAICLAALAALTSETAAHV